LFLTLSVIFERISVFTYQPAGESAIFHSQTAVLAMFLILLNLSGRPA